LYCIETGWQYTHSLPAATPQGRWFTGTIGLFTVKIPVPVYKPISYGLLQLHVIHKRNKTTQTQFGALFYTDIMHIYFAIPIIKM